MRIVILLGTIATALLGGSAVMAQLPGRTSSQAELVSEVKTIAPGSTFTLALSLRHPPGWHSYYRNSGGIELPLAIDWKLPPGFTAGNIQWPVPEAKDGALGTSFIYHGNPVFLIDLQAPAALTTGASVTLNASASWQICEEGCINEEKDFALILPVGTALETDTGRSGLFAKARAALPVTTPGLVSSAETVEDAIVLRITGLGNQAGTFTDFIPDQPFAASVSAGSTMQTTDGELLLRLKRNKLDLFDNEIPLGNEISGILLGPADLIVPATPFPPPSASAEEAPAPATLTRYLGILGGMFLGGLILNLMPCVFPVIGLKIMGFVQQAGADRKKIALHGWIFTLGVVASFGVLSGMLLILRSVFGSDAIGWGYQLQQPWVVLALLVLLFVIALNLFGLFEIGVSATSVGGNLQSKDGFLGTFFSGILATVVATPCSAPFLGAAIGAAIVLPAVSFFGAFAAMAIGLSTPYLLLSSFPKLLAFLPRPGAWMESFKQGMSFLMFATAGYLLWVYAGLIDLENLLYPILGLTLIAAACWTHGRWNLPYRSKETRATAKLIALALLASGVFLARPPATPDPAQAATTLIWQPWSQATQDSLLAEGKTVYVDFTASWCLTCQVNKKRAYTDEVIALMNKKGVVALRADKTKPNTEIERALGEYGRTAIPVNVFLSPGKEPVILPELLSADHLMDALGRL
jgi:thiol:disulfide interchange protein DsbD